MKKILIFVAILVLSKLSFSYGDSWINMHKTGGKSIPRSIGVYQSFAECYYKQLFGGFNISITIEGSEFLCPNTIKYNPVIGKWKKSWQL